MHKMLYSKIIAEMYEKIVTGLPRLFGIKRIHTWTIQEMARYLVTASRDWSTCTLNIDDSILPHSDYKNSYRYNLEQLIKGKKFDDLFNEYRKKFYASLESTYADNFLSRLEFCRNCSKKRCSIMKTEKQIWHGRPLLLYELDKNYIKFETIWDDILALINKSRVKELQTYLKKVHTILDLHFKKLINEREDIWMMMTKARISNLPENIKKAIDTFSETVQKEYARRKEQYSEYKIRCDLEIETIDNTINEIIEFSHKTYHSMEQLTFLLQEPVTEEIPQITDHFQQLINILQLNASSEIQLIINSCAEVHQLLLPTK